MVHFKRHIAKAVSYRLMGTGATVLGALALGVSVDVAGMIGAVELIVKPLAYYLHERLWYRFIHYGIQKS